MLNEQLEVFHSQEFGQVRTLTLDGEPWFVGKDVAQALGYEKAADAVRKHVDLDDKGVSKMEPPGGTQEIIIINESGLYSLILSSKLESAKRFKRWVTREILPAIRKTGSYTLYPTRPITTDDYFEAAKLIAHCRTDKRVSVILGLLQKAGFELLGIEEAKPIEIRNEEFEKKKIMEILSHYSLGEAAKKCGICRTSLHYYRKGLRLPPPDRCELIINILG